MQIRFLLGPAGSGKTFLCLSEIRAALAASPEGPPLILLAPKQATFQLERQLLADDSLCGYTRLRILSFERLAGFIFDQLRSAPPKMLDEEGRLMVLRALLAKKRDELKLFRASARLTGFARQLSLVLREFQSNQLTSDALRKLAADAHDAGSLSSKLHDLALLLESYLAWLEAHGLQDVNCVLSAATDALKSPKSKVQSPKADGAKMIGGLWLDGFAELSVQELALLAALVPHCERATLAFCLDANAPADSWLSHWASVQKTVEQCRKTLSAIPGAEISTKSLVRDLEKSRFVTPALATLEQSWSETDLTQHATCNTPHAGLHLVTCTDPDAEAIFAAREILKFIRTPRTDKTQNRFRDAAVLVRDLEKYHEPLQRVFSRYGIPFFLDRRESVAHHPLAELTRSSLRTIVFQWPHDDWFAALKTGLVPVVELEIDRLLPHHAFPATCQEPIHIENQPQLSEQLESIRKKIILPFEKLAAQLMAHQNRPTGPQLAAALRVLWEDLRVEEQLQKWSEETRTTAFAAPGSIHSTVRTQMESWLQNISLAFDNEPMALRDWLPVLEAGLANLTVGVIPPALDQVLIGAIDRSRNPDLKRAYVLGMNEGVFPAIPSAPALLTEADRETLSRRGANLGPSLRERMAQERYFGYIACTRSSEQLAVTCARQDSRGAALNPSLFVAQLQRIFPRAEMEEFSAEPNPKDIEHIFEILPALLRGDVVDSGELQTLPSAEPVFAQWQRWHSLASPEKLVLSSAAAASLYGKELRSSISALEMFAECPFEYFVRYGLRADERALFEADPRQTGSFQHEILSRFHEQLRGEQKRWRDITPQNARDRIAAIGFDLSRTFGEGLFEADERSRFMARALIEQLQNLLAALVAWMRQYEFDPVEVELSFGLGPNDLPAWKLPLGDGKCLELCGKIDRVDLWRAPAADEALAVIVDYKSSGKKLDPIFLHHGMQLQLLSYLNALTHLPDPKKVFGVGKILPAGVFYVPLRAKADSGDSRYEVLDRAAASALAAYQHTGRFDGKALPQLDNRGLEKGDQFKFAKKKDGEFYKRGEAMTTEAFGALLEKIENDLRSHGERIFAGDIAAKPYRKGNDRACDWCQFQPVCRFDSWIHPFNVLRKPPEEDGTKKEDE
ncbi:MAG TPA: PD-(D/E)XK nuclease family protein [Candidatus Polarisedimenticolia bacterium]|nr:PD-(D/E)XK nuclease family protein [Candidatus Polarisedimenticolia bacterium]